VKPALRVAALVLLVALVAPLLASACPLCKEASSDADKPGATSVWRGMYWSILFMVAAPFAMVGTMIVMIRRARRHGVAAEDHAERVAASSAFRVPSSKLGNPASELET
jgi:heme/copper-type cytochrome/quinol oxidase subunit 2